MKYKICKSKTICKIITPIVLLGGVSSCFIPLLTSCSQQITHSLTDNTNYDTIIKPAAAQTVTSQSQLRALSDKYLNDPQKVAADWAIAQALDAEAILYHGRSEGIFSAPMNREVYDTTDKKFKYVPQTPTAIQPASAVDFFNNTDVERTNTVTDFTNAVIDPNATTTHNVRQTTDTTSATGPYIENNGYYGRFDTTGHYLFGGSRHWRLETKVTWYINKTDHKNHYTLYSHVVYDRPVYCFWAPTDNFVATSADNYDFHYHGYWGKEFIYQFKDVTFSDAGEGTFSNYPYGIFPTGGMYYNGLRNEAGWTYQAPATGKEANCIVKIFGSEWDADEDFYGYGHYDPLQQFDVIPHLEKKENKWINVESDSCITPSPLNDHTWISGSYYFDNLTIDISEQLR